MARQRGVALLIVLLAIVLGVGYAGLRGLNAAYAKPERDARTLAAMQQAKQALLGYAANRVRYLGLVQIEVPAVSARDVPGALPCPTLPQATAGVEYGRARQTCTTATQRLGRLPWRTLEIPELTAAGGEALWYAVSENFRYSTTSTPVLNAASTGQIRLTSGGVVTADRIVAVIVAPGAVLPGQQRGTSAERDSAANYLERFAVAPVVGIDFDFYAGQPTDAAPPFNDLIVTITEAELFDAIENSIARRLDESILPLLEGHRTFWGTVPYATGYFDPQQPALNLAAAAGALSGHLPVAPQVPRYRDWVQVGGTGTATCSAPGGGPLPDPQVECTITGGVGATFTVDVTVENANAALFAPPLFSVDVMTGSATTALTGADVAGTLDGRVRVQGTIVSGSPKFTLTQPVQTLSASPPPPGATEWFVYSQWARFVYYARCSDPSTACISIAQTSAAPAAARAVLVLGGRPVMKPDSSAQTRPSSLAADYLEPPHDTLPTLAFQRGLRTSRFNDRVVALP